MSFAVTSSIVWCCFSPLIAEYMPRSTGDSPCLRDDRAVDVREDVVTHVTGVDRRDDGPVLDGDDEGRSVDEDYGLARALAGRAGHALLQPHERLRGHVRSEEHTSELQSRQYLVCRLLLE